MDLRWEVRDRTLRKKSRLGDCLQRYRQRAETYLTSNETSGLQYARRSFLKMSKLLLPLFIVCSFFLAADLLLFSNAGFSSTVIV